MLVLAVWNGWRQGFVMQVCSLAGIVAGIWLASRYGAEVGDMAEAGRRRFQLPEDSSWCFWRSILLVAIAGRLVRKLCHFAGFGIADIVLGIAVSVLKYMLVLSVLFSAFDSLNEDYTLDRARRRSRNRRVTNPSCASPKPYFPVPGMGRRAGAAAGAEAKRRLADGKTIHRHSGTRHRKLVRRAARRRGRPLPHPRAGCVCEAYGRPIRWWWATR